MSEEIIVHRAEPWEMLPGWRLTTLHVKEGRLAFPVQTAHAKDLAALENLHIGEDLDPRQLFRWLWSVTRHYLMRELAEVERQRDQARLEALRGVQEAASFFLYTQEEAPQWRSADFDYAIRQFRLELAKAIKEAETNG